MNLWFGREKDNIPHHNMVLQFSNADKIYEYYCLLGIVDILLELGFNEELEKEILINIMSNIRNFVILKRRIHFIFIKSKMKITLYYQPVIYSDSNKFDNNIGLFRVDKFLHTRFYFKKRKRWRNHILYFRCQMEKP